MPNQMAYRATGTIRVARFVSPSGENTVAESTAGQLPCGISQVGGRDAPVPLNTTSPVQAAISGDSLNVFGEGEVCLLTLGTGGCTAGALLKSDASGQGIALVRGAGTKENYGARAIQAGAAGAMVSVVVMTGVETTPA